MTDWVQYIFRDLWVELGDPLTVDYFWIRGGPWLTILATAVYLYTVLKWGPEFMRNRKPFDLKLAIRAYNLLLVAINLYLFIKIIGPFRGGIDYWGCGSLRREKSHIVLTYGHLFFHTRYLEFFDTFFFILRKKNSQLSFLHIFHHGIVPILMYIGLKFYPVPFNTLLPTTNVFVHVIMYAYYGLATFGPGIQKYLWWKKYLTTLQIGQFVLLMLHCIHAIVLRFMTGCDFPRGLLFINMSTGLTFFLLFLSFYRETYRKERDAAKKKDVEGKTVKLPVKTNGVPKTGLLEFKGTMDTPIQLKLKYS